MRHRETRRCKRRIEPDWQPTAPMRSSRSAGGLSQRAVLELLAEGEPVPIKCVAAAAGMSASRAGRLLHALGAELDEEGRLIGLGLTLRPTQHRIELKRRTLYTWCALDTLIFPRFLGPARVESPCSATGTPIQLTLTPERIEVIAPPRRSSRSAGHSAVSGARRSARASASTSTSSVRPMPRRPGWKSIPRPRSCRSQTPSSSPPGSPTRRMAPGPQGRFDR